MKVTEEAGVLARSERFFATPGTVARGLFYYITRAGHYYYDENYDFRDNCEIAHLESHRNFYLLYVRAGTMYVRTDHEFSVERGQAALVDCRRPHRFFTHGDAEALWLHFDGANSGAFFEQIIAFHGGRQVFTPAAALHLEQELAQLISACGPAKPVRSSARRPCTASCAACSCRSARTVPQKTTQSRRQCASSTAI